MTRTFTDSEVQAAYSAAPSIIQDALASDDLVDLGVKMQSTYKLHVDTMGAISDLIRNLLIGLINPVEFVTSVQELNVDPTTTQKIVRDLNQKIFIPLQEKMKGEPQQAPISPSTKNGQPIEEILPTQIPEPIVPPTPVAPQITAAMTPPVVVSTPTVSMPTPKPTPTIPTPKPAIEKKIIKEYGADPYREPIQ